MTAGLAPGKKQTIIIAAISVVLALALGWLASRDPALAIAGAAGAALGVLMILSPKWGLFLSLATLIIGQMVRLPLVSQDASITPNDLLLPVLAVSWLITNLVARRFQVRWTPASFPILLIIAAMTASLVANAGALERRELLVSGLFFLRFLEYLVVFFIAQDVIKTRSDVRKILKIIIGIGVVLAILGFIQLRLFPDFSFMVPKGWDPHVGRLLSTWFDPNFLSAYLDVALLLALSQGIVRPPRQALPWLAVSAVLAVAVMFTFSRSGYVALAAGFFLLTLVRARWLFALGVFLAIGIFLFSPRVQERVIGIRSVDETAQLRLVSWNNALTIIRDHPVFGVGYNAYRYAQLNYGFVKDTQEHSASGSDSSLLTMWVTTGPVGLGALIWLWLAGLWLAWKQSRSRRLDTAARALALGAAASLAALFVHAQFVNSFFYPHLLELFWVLLALVLAQKNISTEESSRS